MAETLRMRQSRLDALLSHLFTKAVYRQIATYEVSPAGAEILSHAAFRPDEGTSLGDFLDKAFDRLSRAERSEYVFKNAIAEKILLGRHSLNSARMLLEFRIGVNKADAVIVNGTSTAYEIKSERDSLARLDDQVHAYLSVCERVNVVCSERHLSRVQEQVPAGVGILVLTDRYQLSALRVPSEDLGRLDLAMMFESLQRNEYMGILKDLLDWTGGGVPNGLLHQKAKGLFQGLPIEDIHPRFVQALRHRATARCADDFVMGVPRSLKALALSTPLVSQDRAKFLHAVNCSAQEAFPLLQSSTNHGKCLLPVLSG